MSAIWRKLFSVLLGVGLAGAPRALPAQSCGVGQLTLSATGSLTLPSTFGITGVDAARDGRLTLWSPDGELLLVDAARRLTTYQLPDTVSPVGVAAYGDDGFRLIDTRTGRELLARTNGSVTALSGDLRGPSEMIERALPWENGWILGLIDLNARQFVVRLIRPEGSRTLFRSAAADSASRILRYNVSATATGVLLSLGSAPYTVLRLDPSSGRIETLPAPLAGADALAIPADSLWAWRSVSVVSLDCSLVLTLSDLTSDRRILVRYDADDQVDRLTRVNAPVGFMARIPGTSTLLGARRAGELELVWYDWRWVREPSSAGH
jgi:hypothetical protein